MARTVDWGGYLAPGIELIYEHGPGRFRAQWEALQEMVAVVPPRAGGGDRQAPHLSLVVNGRRPASPLWDENGGAASGGPGAAAVAPGVLHDNPRGRLPALDRVGIDVQLLNPGGTIAATRWLPSNLAAGVLGAYNRYAIAYAAAAPERLRAVVQLHGGEPEWSAAELRELASEKSVAAASIWLPGVAPDDPRFMPIWQVLDETGVPLFHRPELCSPIWTPQRLLAVIGFAGIFERYRGLRVVFGSGTAWLADWLGRLEDLTAGSAGGAGVRELVEAGRLYACSEPGEALGAASPSASLQADHLLWESGFPYLVPEPLGSAPGDPRVELALNRGPEPLIAAGSGV